MGTFPFSQFQEIEFKVGQITTVEEIPGADRLYKIAVSLGVAETVVVAGLKPYYRIKDLLGKKVSVIVNLEPKVIRGVASCGMILAASTEDRTQMVLISPEKDIPAGAIIK